MKNALSFIYIFDAAVLWGCIALFYRSLSSLGFSPIQVVLLRVGCSTILMFLYIIMKDASLLRIRLKDCWLFIGTGVVSLAFFNICYFQAIRLLSPSVAAVLLYTAPVFVMVLSVLLFKEQVTLRKCFSLVVTLFGCLCVTGAFGSGTFTAIGILFGIGSGIGYALYSIFGVVALKRYATETITFYTFLFATISVLPICHIPSLFETITAHPTETLKGSFMIGMFASLLPYVLYTSGLKSISPSTASVVATLEPVVASVIGFVWLNDTMSLTKTVGIILILGAILLLNIPINKKKV
ncbi:MAG: EamA family transporter [Clostridia bacterium]|nr:EamA family transporter [Clostridia bacterium]